MATEPWNTISNISQTIKRQTPSIYPLYDEDEDYEKDKAISRYATEAFVQKL